MCVHGPTGSRSSFTPVKKMSFGPWPRKCAAIGPPNAATSTRKMMKKPLAIATLSRRKRIHTCSQ